MARLVMLGAVMASVAAQQNGPRYLDPTDPSLGYTKFPGCLDGRYCLFPVDRAQFMPGQIFDAYVEVHGADVPQCAIDVRLQGSSVWTPITALLPADGRTPVTSTKSWTLTYTDPDFSRFNTTIRNALATSTIAATGQWVRRVAMNAVGTHTARLTCGADVRSVQWTVLAPSKRLAKRVILFIGDGLNIPIITASRLVSRGQEGGYHKDWLFMQTADRIGTLSTSGVDAIVTDSANSAFSYAAGHKSSVNALGVYVDSNSDDMDDPRVELLTERIRRELPRTAIGVVTTSEIQDATPAAWWSHTRRRSNKAEITYQMLYGTDGFPGVRPDVVMGGGGRYFNGSDLTNTRIPGLAGRNLWTEAEALGYTVVLDKEAMKAAASRKTVSPLLGVWHYENVDTWIDRHITTQNLSPASYPIKYATAAEQALYRKNVTAQPDLREATEAALLALDARGGDDGFFLMVEGASIDKMEHPMDFDRAYGELLDFDNAIGVAMAYARSHKDTLVLVTSDHAQGFDVYGSVDTVAFNAVNKADGSAFNDTEYAAAEAAKINAVGLYQAAGWPDYVDANGDNFPDSWTPRFTLAAAKTDHPALYREGFQLHQKTRAPDMSPQNPAAAASSSLGEDKNGLRLEGVLEYAQGGGQTVHTMADVPLYATGPGSELVKTHMDNVDVHAIMARALGLGSAVATYPAVDPAPNGGAVRDATCDAVVPQFVRHATLGLLTTACKPGATICDASAPIVVGSKTYFRVTASMEALHLQPAGDTCTA